MTPVKDKNFSNKNLRIFHKYIFDFEIYSGSTNEHAIFSDRDIIINSSKIISKEELKLKRSLKNKDEMPTEIWMG